MDSTTGDKIILQIVPTIAENVLDFFEGETVMKWKNLTLKRLEDQDICIWQQISTNEKNKEIDSSLFLPQVNAIVIFYEIHDKTTIVEWLRAIVNDIRLKYVTPIIVGCYQKGENTKGFKELFMNDSDTAEAESRVFLWRVDQGEEDIVDIYQKILALL